jgi:Domain of unknown function (DUF6438)
VADRLVRLESQNNMNRALNWILIGVFFWFPRSYVQDSKSAIDIPEAEAAEHRIGTRGPIYTSNNIGHIIPTTTLEVLVGTDGNVRSARAGGGFFGDLALLGKTWEYTPFERNTHPITAKIRESVATLPIGERPEVHVPFPEIRDWNSLRITLARSGCYGMCSTYKIEIHGDGTVLYEGEMYVRTVGERKVQISHASLVKLLDTFREADYFSLADGYLSAVTDGPTYASSISFDGLSKSVFDYAGRGAGMPLVVSDLESAIDQLSGASKWIGRKQSLCPSGAVRNPELGRAKGAGF